MVNIEDRMQQLMHELEEQSRKATELQSAVQDVRGTATSPDQTVTVTVAPSGAVLDLQLSPDATRRSHTALQQTIMATIQAAGQQATEQLNNAAAPILGDRLQQFQEALRDSGPGNASNPGVSPSEATQRAGDSEDFSDDTFLR